MEPKAAEDGGAAPVDGEESSSKASLYVGDLEPQVSESDLIEAFSCLGLVSSARVLRDSSGSSLRYAYVNFPSRALAENALKEMNHCHLKGRPMRVMRCIPDPFIRKSGIGNLYVKNLEQSVDGLELEKLFSKYGTVISCKVMLDEAGKSKGFGFVQMNSEEAATLAREALNGKVPKDGAKMLYVSKFKNKSERQSQLRELRFCNLYVKNLDADITVDLLQTEFSKFGKLKSVAVMKDEAGQSKGFGFVNFELPEHAKDAMAAMNGSQLGSKILYVAPAQKKAERSKMLELRFAEKSDRTFHDAQIFVKNLDVSVDEEELSKQFDGCGKIVSAEVARDSTGRSKGFGFLFFSSSEEANKAIALLNGTSFHGKTMYVGTAQSKGDRDNAYKKLQIAQSYLPAQTPLNTWDAYCSSSLAPPMTTGQQLLLYQQQQQQFHGVGYPANNLYIDGFRPTRAPSFHPNSSPAMMTENTHNGGSRAHLEYARSQWHHSKGAKKGHFSQFGIPKGSNSSQHLEANTEHQPKIIMEMALPRCHGAEPMYASRINGYTAGVEYQ